MATFRQRGKAWEVSVCCSNIRKSATFPTKIEARSWAAQTELDIRAGKSGAIPNKPFSALLERYRDEVSCTKRGERWERMRIGLFLRDEIAAVPLPALNASHFAAWRDRRLRSVSAGSVRREWTLLSHALNVATREWKWLIENPIKDVRRPPPPQSRDRRITPVEEEALLFSMGVDKSKPPQNIIQRVGFAMLFALETAMRAGEICSLKPGSISGSVARLPITKNGTAREVALSKEALRIIGLMPDAETIFELATSQIDAHFRKAKAKALIDDLHFHDTRHEAITRLAGKLDVLDLARMVGIRDLRILMVYYNATAKEIADKL